MGTTVLVAYATRYGSTREVAEAIAETLRGRRLEVEVQAASEVETVDGYSAIVLGAPFFVGKWHGDAQRFLSQHQEPLSKLPVAVFALGPIGTNEARNSEAPRQLDEALAKFPWLHPLAQRMFGGKYEPSRLTLMDRFLGVFPASPLHGMEASDLRDWGAIRSWAGGLAEKLLPAPVH